MVTPLSGNDAAFSAAEFYSSAQQTPLHLPPAPEVAPSGSVLNAEAPELLDQAGFDRYLEATGNLYGVGLHGGEVAGRRRYGMDSQLVKHIQVADDGLDQAVAKYNKAHGDAPLDKKRLNLEQVATLRQLGLYQPDQKTARALTHATELYSKARQSLTDARHAASMGQHGIARESIKQFHASHRELRKESDDYSQDASDAAHGTVRNWERAQKTADTAFFLTSSAAVFAASLNPVSRAAMQGAGATVTQVAAGLGMGTGLGMAMSMYKRGGEEIVRSMTGEKASMDRFARGVVSDTIDAAQTSLSAVMAPAALSHVAARSVQAGARFTALAMNTKAGQAVTGAVIGAGTDIASQAANIATHALRRDGTAAPEFSLRSVGVSAVGGAISHVAGSAIGKMAMARVNEGAREFARNTVSAGVDLTTGAAQVAAMNVGTDQPWLGTLEQNTHMVFNTLALGYASTNHAAAPHLAAPPRAQGPASSPGWRFAEKFSLPAFGLQFADGPGMPGLVFMSSTDDGGGGARAGRGSGTGKPSSGDAAASSGVLRFYPEGHPLAGDGPGKVDEMYTRTVEMLEGREELAHELMSEFDDAERWGVDSPHEEAGFLMAADPESPNSLLAFVDEKMHERYGDSKDAPKIHVPGRFLRLGLLGEYAMPPGKPDPLDVLLERVKDRCGGDEARAHKLIEESIDGDPKWIKVDRLRAQEALNGGDEGIERFLSGDDSSTVDYETLLAELPPPGVREWSHQELAKRYGIDLDSIRTQVDVHEEFVRSAPDDEYVPDLAAEEKQVARVRRALHATLADLNGGKLEGEALKNAHTAAEVMGRYARATSDDFDPYMAHLMGEEEELDVSGLSSVRDQDKSSYRTRKGGFWLDHVPLGFMMAEQGYKLHVSAKPENALQIADQVLPILRKLHVEHKVIATPDLYKQGMEIDPNQVGKYIAIYPASDEQAIAVERALTPILRHYEGPAVPMEKTAGESNLLFYRYGAFRADENDQESYTHPVTGETVIWERGTPGHDDIPDIFKRQA